MASIHLSSACLGIPVLLASLGAVVPQEPEVRNPREVAQQILGKDWIVEREEPVDAVDRVACFHSFTGRLRARGGFPYEKLLLSRDGELLARSSYDELYERTHLKRLRITLREGEPDVMFAGTSETAGLKSAIRHLVAKRRFEKPEVSASLGFSLYLLQLLTLKGELVSASLERIEGRALSIAVSWKQGSGFWGYEELARWTFTFDRRGALTRIEKSQEKLEDMPRR